MGTGIDEKYNLQASATLAFSQSRKMTYCLRLTPKSKAIIRPYASKEILLAVVNYYLWRSLNA